MIPLAIKLFLGSLWKRLTALLSLVGRYPWQAAVIALCGLSLWLWHGKSVQHRGWVAEIAARNADKVQWQANLAAQIAQVKAQEAKSAAQAKDNAHVETEIRTVYRDRGNANAERMRFDKVCRSPASSPGQDSPAPVDHGPGPDAVLLERRDYDLLIDNTARLEAVHQWGEALLKDGTAVKAENVFPDPAF